MSKCVTRTIKEFSDANCKYLTRIVKENGITIAHNHIDIFRMLDEKEQTFTSLINNLNYSKSTLSDVINKYTEMGLIEKKTCSKDKRVTYICLSNEGIEMFNTFKQVNQQYRDALFAGMNEEHIEMFTNILELLTKNLNDIQ